MLRVVDSGLNFLKTDHKCILKERNFVSVPGRAVEGKSLPDRIWLFWLSFLQWQSLWFWISYPLTHSAVNSASAHTWQFVLMFKKMLEEQRSLKGWQSRVPISTRVEQAIEHHLPEMTCDRSKELPGEDFRRNCRCQIFFGPFELEFYFQRLLWNFAQWCQSWTTFPLNSICRVRTLFCVHYLEFYWVFSSQFSGASSSGPQRFRTNLSVEF